ncbi:MAG: hypothetical protein OXM87_11635, partial [Truepera sp.]|nr:hypothetical protein [Truepera sp.]
VHPLPAGSVLRLETGGGGGFGNPLDRDPAKVREDVLDGYVTPEGAERDYGVVLHRDATVDEAATEGLRAQRRQA